MRQCGLVGRQCFSLRPRPLGHPSKPREVDAGPYEPGMRPNDIVVFVATSDVAATFTR